MEIKWFFVIFGILLTGAILLGQLFIGSHLSQQDRVHFQATQNNSDTKFNHSIIIHDFLFDNITDLKKDLDPILDQIPNATQSRLDQDRHYSQAILHFNELNVMNQTINKILEILNKTSSTNGTIIPVPVPVIINVTEPITDNNITKPINPPVPTPIPGPLINNTTKPIIDDRGGLGPTGLS